MKKISRIFALVASFLVCLSFADEVGNKAPMCNEFLQVAAAPTQVKAAANLQTKYTEQIIDSCSIILEALKIAPMDNEEMKAFATLLDSLVLKEPQYIYAGLEIKNTKDDPLFIGAIQFKGMLQKNEVEELKAKLPNELTLFTNGGNVLVFASKDKKGTYIRPANKPAKQSDILKDEVYAKMTADLSSLIDEMVKEAGDDMPIKEFNDFRKFEWEFGKKMTLTAIFAKEESAKAFSDRLARVRGFLVTEFADYPLSQKEIKNIKITVKQVEAGARLRVSLPYYAIGAIGVSFTKEENQKKIGALFLGTPEEK